MKKILLVPLMAISLLVGCNTNQQQEKETLYTVMDWFQGTDVIENELKFYVNGGGTKDYGKKVADRMLEFFEIDFKFAEPVKKIDANDLMTYTIKKNMGPYTQFNIHIHEKCIETRAVGTLKGKTIEQLARCETYSGFGAAYIISFAAKRDDEIYKITKEEYNAAEEVATLENFYQGIEESTTNPIATFSNVTREDAGHALLDDFKELFNGHNEKAYGANKDYAFMTYGLNDNFMLSFYLDRTEDCIAILEYKYQCSLGYTGSVTTGYKVNREKVDNIIKKITIPAN